MSALSDTIRAPRAIAPAWLEWLPVALGLAVLYLPTYATLARGPWDRDDGAHGPIVLAIILWILWRARVVLTDPPRERRVVAGTALFAFGLALYVLGRSQSILTFEIGSHIPVIAGVLLILRGTAAARTWLVPLAFFVFLIPPPGFIVDMSTAPLKLFISSAVEQGLYGLGYPIARSGVVLAIGRYELLVADACSGMNSIISLSALGVLYLYLVGHRDPVRVGLVLASIVPIAVFANMLRVAALVLITYYWGDEAGQGFLHGASGMVVFIAALLALLAFDGLLGRVFKAGAR